MARPKNPVPTYRHHHKKDRGVVEVYVAPGRRVSMLLPGPYNSAESKAAYAKVVGTVAANNGMYPAKRSSNSTAAVSIDELVLQFMSKKASVDYVDAEGNPTTEFGCFRAALRPLCRLFGSTLADSFDSADLIVVREAMISGSWMNAAERERQSKRKQPIGWCRTNVNKAISRIRQVFRWGVPYKLVATKTLADLECLPGLQPGQGGTREMSPILPVDDAIVEATLPHLPPTVADIIRLLKITGARCGEICAMRMADIDRRGPNWIYRPRRHKTKKMGHDRTIVFGPKSQSILGSYLNVDPDAYVFSPREQAKRIAALKRANRKTPVQPSQLDRSKPTAKRVPGDFFIPSTISHAVLRACKRQKIDHWHPHQLSPRQQ